MMRAYRACRAPALIDLIQAMQLAGVDEQSGRGWPSSGPTRLVYCRVDQDGSAQFAVTSGPRQRLRVDRWSAAAGDVPGTVLQRARVECRARVPSIRRGTGQPPSSGDTSCYGGEWVTCRAIRSCCATSAETSTVMPKWDLAPVEQAILRARRRQ